MKKIAMILVPLQVCPGESSLSALLMNLLEENEKQKKVNMMIFSKYSDEAERESKKYPNTKFTYIKLGKLDKVMIFLYRAIKKIFKKKIFFLDRYYYKCYKICQKEKFDKIIAEAGAYQSYEAYAERLGRDKMVLHLHQDNYEKKHEKIFSTVICVSEFLKRKVEAVSQGRLLVNVLKNGINLEKFKRKVSAEQVQRLRDEMKLRAEDYVVIFCGRLFEGKGVLELIRSFKSLPDCLKLLIIGTFDDLNGEFAKDFQSEVGQLEDKVRVIGYVNYNEIYQYYALADLQVIPSKWEEAAGLVAIEGMVRGVPIIATKAGGMVEYIDDACALIIEKDNQLEKNIADAILQLYQDKERCKKMSEQGMQRAELFSKEKYYDDFVALVESWE